LVTVPNLAVKHNALKQVRSMAYLELRQREYFPVNCHFESKPAEKHMPLNPKKNLKDFFLLGLSEHKK